LPATGPAGTLVSIAGVGLEGVTNVRFGGAEARFSVNPPRFITAVVPATTPTKDITVVTRQGTTTFSVPSSAPPTMEPPEPLPPPVAPPTPIVPRRINLPGSSGRPAVIGDLAGPLADGPLLDGDSPLQPFGGGGLSRPRLDPIVRLGGGDPEAGEE
jgi:hypothetical protein